MTLVIAAPDIPGHGLCYKQSVYMERCTKRRGHWGPHQWYPHPSITVLNGSATNDDPTTYPHRFSA